jgi:hypothetical protein
MSHNPLGLRGLLQGYIYLLYLFTLFFLGGGGGGGGRPGVQLGPFGTAATKRPIVPAPGDL